MTTESEYDRLLRYARRYFKRHGSHTFPTVRECARALGWKQTVIEEVVEGNCGELQLTSFHLDDELGDHFVEEI